jgi:hypothetical protein
MSKTVLIITAIFEILLAATRWFASYLKRKDKYGSDERPAQWEILPYKFEVDYLQEQNADKELKPPKAIDPHSRDV